MGFAGQDLEYLKSLKILIVEDDADAIEQLGRFLGRRVGSVLSAMNGADGLVSFRTNSPHIIITDILMPEMDGLTMAQEVRKLNPAVPIIFITAFERTEYLMRAIEIGIDKYVLKPVNTERLEETLVECTRHLRAEELLLKQREHEAEIRRLEAVGILAGGMAHDYNNLLQSVIGYIGLAKMVVEPGSQAFEYIEKAEKSSEQGRDLGQRLLIFAKGSLAYFKTGELAQVIEHSVNNTVERNTLGHEFKYAVKTIMNGQAVTLEFNIAADMPPISMDESQLPLVFNHLTQNAIEAMPAGGKLRVSAKLRDVPEGSVPGLLPGKYIHVTFRDSGVGIPSENLPKIFDPYFSTKMRGSIKGMGLGLALCHVIIRKHSGLIFAKSKPGKGSTFHIFLPIFQPSK